MTGVGEFGAGRSIECEAVVLVTQRVSDVGLYDGVVADGHRLAREIDLEDPARPRPHRRELALPRLGSSDQEMAGIAP
ncbi:MAG: hypothetical protein ACOYD4_12775 [Solirubrobacterales bacterium]